MTILIQSHGGPDPAERSRRPGPEGLTPAGGDLSVDAAADLGYLLPPSGDPGDTLPDDALAELDQLGTLMVPTGEDATPDSTIPAVFTYWGQFLDHELTARTDREGAFTTLDPAAPRMSAAEIEAGLKNARSPRFDLDSVYGGLPVGPGMTADGVRVSAGMRHPVHIAKMRVGTALTDAGNGPLPDDLDPHRDLPRFGQVQPAVRAAFLRLVRAQMPAEQADAVEATLPARALIGDMRNDENLVIAQFHLSVLRFHNRVVDFLTEQDTGWIPDFASARALTRLHYQWLIVHGYLRGLCDGAVLDRVLADRARGFFAFRDAYRGRNPAGTLGDAIPLEFSVAAFRFGHTMVRGSYDFNRVFGRPGMILPNASMDLLFTFTGGGGFGGQTRLPANWIIDWSRFLEARSDFAEEPQRSARAIDTRLAPPLGNLIKEGGGLTGDARALFRHLARRNLRRGLSLRMPTGQALHAFLRAEGHVTSAPITDVGALVADPAMAAFLRGSTHRLHERTPLWFYILAEAEAAGGQQLGEVGSWIVASTFVGVLLADPDSVLSTGFAPDHSPLRMPDGSVIDSLGRWMRFARVLE